MARKPTQASAIVPPKGMEAKPPDDINKDSILNWAAPKYEELTNKEPEILNELVATFDYRLSEQRLSLLAMLVMEHALWSRDGWSKKERFDAASKALQLIKGTKSSIAIDDEREKGVPKDAATLEKEKQRIAARLTTLLAKEAAIGGKEGKEVTAMIDVIEGEN